MGFFGRFMEHPLEQIRGHEVGTGTGGKVSPSGKQAHGQGIDFTVSPVGGFHGVPALGECRRIQNDVVPPTLVFLFLRQFPEHVEHIRLHHGHGIGYAVYGSVMPSHFHSFRRDVHRFHGCGTRHGTVQPEGTGVGEHVQHPFALCQSGGGSAVVLLVQEEPGFLAVYKVHGILHTVFRQCGFPGTGFFRQPEIGRIPESVIFLQSFQPPQIPCTALVYGGDLHSLRPACFRQQRVQQIPAYMDPGRQHLRYQNGTVPVYGPARKMIRFPENQPDSPGGRGEIVGHDGFPVGDRMGQSPGPESGIEAVVGVGGNQPDPDLGVIVIEPGAQVLSLFGIHIRNVAHGDGFQRSTVGCGHGKHFFSKDPRMTGSCFFCRFFGYGKAGVSSHMTFVLFSWCDCL